MLSNKTRSTLNTTKTGTPSIVSIDAILKENINKISVKYSTSQSYYVVQPINLAIENKPCRLKTILQDEQFNKIDETIQKYYKLNEGEQTAKDLIEYYKYYNQSSILYQLNFFKIMYKYRELKKTVQYNKLKIILDLPESTQQETSRAPKNNITPNCTINILSDLQMTGQVDSQESILLKTMKNNLDKQFGPNCFNTIQELDQNYYFQKKNIDNIKLIDFNQKKTKIHQKIGENMERQEKYKISMKGKRNNSCQSLNSPIPKRIQCKTRKFHQKKHQSMDTFCQLTKDISPYSPYGQPKRKLFQNWVKPSQCSKSKQKPEHQRYMQRSSIYLNSKQNDKGKFSEIKTKINDIKDRIRKEKELIKKKTTIPTNQSQIFKVNKKCNTMASTTEKFWNKKISKQQFS